MSLKLVSSRAGLATLSWMLVLGHASPASAQEVAPVRSADSDEIVVTAQKRSESVQSIPGAITAVGSETLENAGVTDLRGLSALAPGLVFQDHASTTFVIIRGVGASVDTGLAEPSVATYIDGVYLPRPTMAKIRAYDVERVEVLRGPQGTLYGRNSSGGAINYISKKPSAKFEAGFDLGISNYNGRTAEGFVSGPLSDTLRFRVSGSRDVRDGFVKNINGGPDLMDVDFYSFRGALTWAPTPNFSLDLSLSYAESDAADNVQQRVGPVTVPVFPPGTLITIKPWEVASDYQNRSRSRTLLASAVANWDLATNMTLRSTTGFVNHKSNTTFDADATSRAQFVLGPNFLRNSKSFSQEFDLIGEVGILKYIVGAYYFSEIYNPYQERTFPVGLGPFPAGTTTAVSADQNIKSYAVFFDGSLSVTDRVRLNFGGRYNDERNDVVAAAGNVVGGNLVGATGVKKITDSRFLPKAGVEFDVADDVLFYAQFQKGLKSGGVNLGLTDPNFTPETLTSYEVGLKSQFFDRKVTLNLAGFRYDYNGLQTLILPVGGLASRVENADAKITGIDFELRYSPIRKLTFLLGGSVLDHKYTNLIAIDDSNVALGGQNLKGKKLSRVPDYTITTAVDWTVPIQNSFASSLSFHADVQMIGDTYFRPFNTVRDFQSSYALVNGAVTLRFGDDKYAVRAFVRNATNKAAIQTVIHSAAIGGFVGSYIPPRIYGANFSVKF